MTEKYAKKIYKNTFDSITEFLDEKIKDTNFKTKTFPFVIVLLNF